MTLKKVVLEMITETKKYAEDIVQQSRNTNASKKYILSDYRLLGFVRQLCGTLPGGNFFKCRLTGVSVNM